MYCTLNHSSSSGVLLCSFYLLESVMILYIIDRRPFGVEKEFHIQLFVEHDPSLKVPTVGELLKRMFKEMHISFKKVLYHVTLLPYSYFIWSMHMYTASICACA